MSRTASALAIKLAMTLVLAWISIGLIDRNPTIWVFLIAIIATVVNYVIGDLMVLPNMGNTVASVANGVMAAIVAWIVSLMVIRVQTTLTGLAVFGILIAVGEYFFHQYQLSSDEVAP